MTKIEWTHRANTKGESWNMIAGCTKVSPGCANCYALRDSWRIMNNPKRPERYADVCERVGNRPPFWTGLVNLDYDALEQPLHWRKPRTVFVASMSDLFHDAVPYSFIDRVMRIIASAPQHTYQILTKRAERMRHYFERGCFEHQGEGAWGMPLDNVWLGVTAENQEQADRRIPHLLETPAALRYVSVEPMLGPVDLCEPYPNREMPGSNIYYPWMIQQLDWIIIGGESGSNARPMDLRWTRDLIGQCHDADVPVFVKQLGSAWAQKAGRYTDTPWSVGDPGRKGENIEAWPKDVRVREFPR